MGIKAKHIIININKRKKIVILSMLLITLIFMYCTMQYFEAKAAITNEIYFENKTEKMEFLLGGETVGIKLLATGVLVIGIDNEEIGLNIGDVILKVDDTNIESNRELIDYINRKEVMDRGSVKLKVDRSGKEIFLSAMPIYSTSTNKYELGLWVKDSSAGVGTITFYEKNNKLFAGLGHGITETSENVVVPINSGAIVKTIISGIKKGYPKEPGDIKGTLYKDVIGQIRKNSINGIYGVMEKTNLFDNKKVIKAMSKHQIKEGNAKIHCTLDDNSVQEFNIKISKVLLESTGNKNMIIEVIDKVLLEKTGGIVQGMSGSPIVQDGMLVGAVTHVFLNDPKRGYGVFIENIIEDISSIE